MNQAIIFNDDVQYLSNENALQFSAMVAGSTVMCIVNMGCFSELSEETPLSYFNKFKFDYEDLAEQLIEEERFNNEGQIIITTQFF